LKVAGGRPEQGFERPKSFDKADFRGAGSIIELGHSFIKI